MKEGESSPLLPVFYGCFLTSHYNQNRMEKLHLEVSTHPAAGASSLLPCLCTVCGLVLSTQVPLFAAEPVPQIASAPKNAKIAAKKKEAVQTIRPMAFRRTTAAPSQAKSQVSKAQNTPIKSLKPTISTKATRFALTTPETTKSKSNSNSLEGVLPERGNGATAPKWATRADERIIMTALPVDDTAPQADATTASAATIQTTAADIRDTATLKAAARAAASQEATIQETAQEMDNSESEPLTGTITIQKKAAAPAPTEPKAPAPTETTGPPPEPGVIVTDTTAPAPAGSTAVTADSKSSQTSRLFAPIISYDGGTIIAEGTAEDPVRLEGTGTRIIARKVRLDTINKVVNAEGSVKVERQVTTERFSTFGNDKAGGSKQEELVTETLQGENFEYNYGTRQGKLGATRVRLANFNISADEIIINGQLYTAHNVTVRPGGLSDEELRIYGTPPFKIVAKTLTVDTSKPAPPNKSSADTTADVHISQPTTARTHVRGANLYFKNFRILPIPAALLGRTLGGPREQETYQLTPRAAYNGADGLLVTVGLKYPFSPKNPDFLTLTTDIGISTKVGFRGGVALDTSNKLGRFEIGARLNDVISSQLTNRIELDRLPEFTYEAPRIVLFDLPGSRRAGLRLEMTAGDYRERFTTGDSSVKSSRVQGLVKFSTRMGKGTGPYLDLTARTARYSHESSRLSTAGFEVGYAGALGSRINGQFSYGATKISGETPFEFDKVAIREELRATFDILLTPRYIIPIDLRYDLDRQQLREKTFGLLRNYKTFAYGVTYQSSRQEVQFQVRQGF